MSKLPYVTKQERKVAKARALKIVRDIQSYLSPIYKINPRLVGSARYNAVIRDINGVYDMDYQLILTNNCRCEKFDANTIRKDFFKAFNTIKNSNEKVENSTSVITVRVSNNQGEFKANKELFSFDFAIIIDCPEGSYITRRDKNNHYTWNKLPSKNSYIYEKYSELSNEEQNIIIDNVKRRKIIEKQKPKNLCITSSVIFMEEVNNFRG